MGGAYVIRKVSTSGIITTIAGNSGISGFSGDGGPATAAKFNYEMNCSAVDAAGNLYIADPNNNRIRKITYNNAGINEVNNRPLNVSIFPNPANHAVIISTDNGIESAAIINLIGQEIYQQSYRKTEKIEIDP